MKTLLRLAIIIALMITGTTSLYAQQEFSRTIEKSCPVTVKAISIDHQYSNVTITEWDKPEIAMTVKIITRARTIEDSKKISECIDVKFFPNLAEGTKIQTEIDHDRMNRIDKNHRNYSINISIKAPRALATTLASKYGNATLNATVGTMKSNINYGNLMVDEIEGAAHIVSKYGNTTIKKLKGNLNSNVKYGNIAIEDAQQIYLSLEYGHATINKATSYSGYIGYGNSEIREAQNVNLDAVKYGHLVVGEFTASLSIKSLGYGSVKATAEDSFTLIDINSSYSPIDLKFSPNVTFNSDITVSYGLAYYKGIGYSGFSSSNNRQVGLCGKDCSDLPQSTKTGKQVKITNRYANIAIIRK